MKLEALKELVQGELFADFDSRVEDLHWRQDTDGVLYVAEDRRSPGVLKALTFGDDGLEIEDAEPATVDWRSLEVVSSPQTTTSRQQD